MAEEMPVILGAVLVTAVAIVAASAPWPKGGARDMLPANQQLEDRR